MAVFVCMSVCLIVWQVLDLFPDCMVELLSECQASGALWLDSLDALLTPAAAHSSVDILGGLR